MPATVASDTTGHTRTARVRRAVPYDPKAPGGNTKYSTALPVTIVLSTNSSPTRRIQLFALTLDVLAAPLASVSVAMYGGWCMKWQASSAARMLGCWPERFRPTVWKTPVTTLLVRDVVSLAIALSTWLRQLQAADLYRSHPIAVRVLVTSVWRLVWHALLPVQFTR